jgi:hypothetical protein
MGGRTHPRSSHPEPLIALRQVKPHYPSSQLLITSHLPTGISYNTTPVRLYVLAEAPFSSSSSSSGGGGGAALGGLVLILLVTAVDV